MKNKIRFIMRCMFAAGVLSLVGLIFSPCLLAGQDRAPDRVSTDIMPVAVASPTNARWFAVMNHQQEWIRDLEVTVNQKNR